MNGLLTEAEFIRIVKEKVSSPEIYSLRVYDFEDLAIKFAYSDRIMSEDEDVEQNNFRSFCENY